MPKSAKRCPECGANVALRMVKGSDSGDTLGVNYTFTWNQQELCVRCEELSCMVRDCKKPAGILIEHYAIIGTGQKATSSRNDVWVCQKHWPKIREQNKADDGFGRAVMAPVIAVWAIFANLICLGSGIGVIVCIVAGIVGFFVLMPKRYRQGTFESLQIKKKSKYIYRARGEDGTRFEDDDFCGKVLDEW